MTPSEVGSGAGSGPTGSPGRGGGILRISMNGRLVVDGKCSYAAICLKQTAFAKFTDQAKTPKLCISCSGTDWSSEQ